eukprot:13199164-Alexandrium_andersonii.AAC.1
MNCGITAFGASPTTIRRMRSVLADAACGGGLTSQACTTTVIHLALGRDHDPALAIPALQIRDWLE